MPESPRAILKQLGKERLILLFIWDALAGPGLLAIQPNRTDFLRRPDGGGQWDSWEVAS
jgi:hypothetical protein